MSDEFRDLIKSYIPEFHKGNYGLDQFLNAAADYLEGFRDAIDDLKDNYNIAEVDANKLDNIAATFDIHFLRNIGLSKKRQFVQEAIDLYRTNGTEKSLIRIFKLIGWQIKIDYCWVVDPAYYDKAGIVNYVLQNDNGASTSVPKYQILFGDDKAYDDNVFVDIRDLTGNTYTQRPIYGENYSVYVEEPLYIKVPYIRLQVTSNDYQAFTADYVDPTTGKIYSYTESEKFQILQDIRDFFLGQSRPANVALFEISTPETFSDSIAYTFVDSLDIEVLNSNLTYDGTHLYGQFLIDRYNLDEEMGGFEFGTTAISYYGVGQTAPQQSFTLTYPSGTIGPQIYTLIRQHTDVTLTVPSDAKINLMATRTDGKQITLGNVKWTFIEQVTNKSNYTVTLSDYMAIFVNIITASSIGDITVGVTLK